MKIVAFTDMANDGFKAVMECEHCGKENELKILSKSMPKMKDIVCANCGKCRTDDSITLTEGNVSNG